MNDDINCPYCGKGQDVNHDDGYGYDEGVLHQQECGYCHKTFTFTTSISFYYEVDKADCLNGGEHNYVPTASFPHEFTMMQCSMCGKERKPTEAEWESITQSRLEP